MHGEDREVHADAHLHGEGACPAHARRAAWHEERQHEQVAANGSSQNDQLFSRANAMSGAPIIIGICQFAKPTNTGMIAPNTMMRPCIVVS